MNLRIKISKFLSYLLLILGCLYIFIYFLKKYVKIQPQEGFTQDIPFVLKRNERKYDDFYIQVYNDILNPVEQVIYTVDSVINSTQPNPQTAVMLDIGSNTGSVVYELIERGFHTFGVDNIPEMINYSINNAPSNARGAFKQCNVTDSMLFDHGVFTHILCLQYGIYKFYDKTLFFDNAHSWLRNNGYLFVHIVHRVGFLQKERETQELQGCNYSTWIEMSPSTHTFKDSGPVLWKENFCDNTTHRVRQNEEVLFMENENEIIDTAKHCGFILKGIVSMEPIERKEQYVYIFERI